MPSLERVPSLAFRQWNTELREKLIDSYISFSISNELSGWLQELGLSSCGTIGQQLARLRQQAASLVLPAETFPRQTIFYLSHYDPDILSEICQELGVPSSGSSESMVKRIYREVGSREGWLHPLPESARLIMHDTFFPLLKSLGVLKDYTVDIEDGFSELFGEENASVRDPLAYGRALIVVVLPDLFQEAQAVIVDNELKKRGLVLA